MIAPLVLSFDLDDTLWPVEPVIRAAEAAMWKWLQEQHAEAMRDTASRRCGPSVRRWRSNFHSAATI